MKPAEKNKETWSKKDKIVTGLTLFFGTATLFFSSCFFYDFYHERKSEKEYENKVCVNEKNIQESPLTLSQCFKSEYTLDELLEMKNKNYTEAIEKIKTPIQAAVYVARSIEYNLNNDDSNVEGYLPSFKLIHKNAKGNCAAGALAAAALLSDNGFEPYILGLYGNDTGHAIFIYKTKDGFFGSIGINETPDINFGYKDINELIGNLLKDYNFTRYKIYDLSKASPDFVDNNTNNNFSDESIFFENEYKDNPIINMMNKKIGEYNARDIIGTSMAGLAIINSGLLLTNSLVSKDNKKKKTVNSYISQ